MQGVSCFLDGGPVHLPFEEGVCGSAVQQSGHLPAVDLDFQSRQSFRVGGDVAVVGGGGSSDDNLFCCWLGATGGCFCPSSSRDVGSVVTMTALAGEVVIECVVYMSRFSADVRLGAAVSVASTRASASLSRVVVGCYVEGRRGRNMASLGYSRFAPLAFPERIFFTSGQSA